MSTYAAYLTDSEAELIKQLVRSTPEEEARIQSTKIRIGMEMARSRGVRIGPMRRFCFAEEVERYRSSVQVGGTRPTIIRTVPEVMAYAESGMSIAEAAKIIGISEKTLRRNLSSVGKLKDYEGAYRIHRRTDGASKDGDLDD